VQVPFPLYEVRGDGSHLAGGGGVLHIDGACAYLVSEIEPSAYPALLVLPEGRTFWNPKVRTIWVDGSVLTEGDMVTGYGSWIQVSRDPGSPARIEAFRQGLAQPWADGCISDDLFIANNLFSSRRADG
jgi:hypothetical protein